MKILAGILSVVFIFIGWVAVGTTTFVWIAHGIYEMITTQLSFWDILLGNGGMWILQGVLGFALVGIGYAAAAFAAD